MKFPKILPKQLVGMGAGLGLVAGIPFMAMEAVAQSRTIPFPNNQVAYIRANNQRVDIQLVNPTNAAIDYQVLGDTELRTLPAGKTIMLKNIPINRPVTVAFHRIGGGFINPQLDVQPNMIRLKLNGTGVFSLDQSAMVIEPSGRIYLY